MLSIDIKDYLIFMGVGTSSTIYAAQIPETVDTGLSVNPSGGLPPDKIADLEYPFFQLLARSKNPRMASDLLQSAMNALHQSVDLTINTLSYKSILTKNSASVLGKDELQRWMYIQDYEVIKEVG